MATKRMIAAAIVDTDNFLDMPPSTQNLYFHLNVRADDDGFVGSPKKIARLVGSTDDDMNLLIAKGYIIPFESGIIVITHFNLHNTLKKDRYHPTIYTEERALLGTLPNKSYVLQETGATLDTERNQGGSEREPEVSLEEKSTLKSGCRRAQEGNYTQVWNSLPSEDYDEIDAVYEDAEKLVSTVDEYVRLHHITIKGSVRNYILGTAEKKGWPKKPTKDPLLI